MRPGLCSARFSNKSEQLLSTSTFKSSVSESQQLTAEPSREHELCPICRVQSRKGAMRCDESFAFFEPFVPRAIQGIPPESG